MHLFTPEELEEYLQNDTILPLMEAEEQPRDEEFASHRWLTDNPAKRLIFQKLYGDLLEEGTPPRRILDVGGGFTSLTRRLLRHHEYHLLDIMAHDSSEHLHQIEEDVDKRFWIPEDWYQFRPDQRYDLIIANDLFPNVDQRLALFLQKFLPITDGVRLSLTFYNTPRFYPTKRLDGDEVLYYLAWDGEQLERTLEHFEPHIKEPCPEKLGLFDATIFPNGRQVTTLEMNGLLHAQAAYSQ